MKNLGLLFFVISSLSCAQVENKNFKDQIIKANTLAEKFLSKESIPGMAISA